MREMIFQPEEAFVVDAPYNESLQTDDHVGRCAPSCVRR
jgi:hypothetical protein